MTHYVRLGKSEWARKLLGKQQGRVRGARTTVYEGQKYHSKSEADQAAELDLLKRAGEIIEWERQFKIPLHVNGFLITTYYADFKILRKDGTVEILESKGFFTEYARLKWKLTEAVLAVEHPEWRLTMVRT